MSSLLEKYFEEERRAVIEAAREEGLKEGIEEGREENKRATALRLAKMGFSPGQIAEFVDSDSTIIESWLAG